MAITPTLTGLLRNRKSAFSQYVAETYPNTLQLRRSIAEHSGDLQVQPGAAPSGTIGTAFDIAARMLLDARHVPLSPARSIFWTEAHDDLVAGLTGIAREALPARDTNPLFYQMVWLLALLTETVRAPRIALNAPINALLFSSTANSEDFLSLVPGDGVRQLRELDRIALEVFYPRLRDPLLLSPSFSTRKTCQAEADLIADTVLIDIKTGLGTIKRDGQRKNVPAASDVHQLIAYSLLDTDDEYGVDQVALYSARYGAYMVFALSEVLQLTSSRQVSLLEERQNILEVIARDAEDCRTPAER